MKGSSAVSAVWIVAAFIAGFCSHLLYLRWNPPATEFSRSLVELHDYPGQNPEAELKSFRLTFAPANAPIDKVAELPVLQAREVEKIRAFKGQRVRIRGRIFRVGHSARSNTYFLNFGPSRAALTAVIFASAVELFEKNKLPPKGFDGREVELQGEIKDHPQYGLEVILEDPSQIKILN